MNVRLLAIPVLLVAILLLLFFGLRGRGGAVPGIGQKQEVKAQPLRSVTVAKAALPRGKEVGLDDIKSKQVTEEEFARLPKDAITDEKLIVGGTTSAAVAADETFTPANLTAAPQQLSQKIEPGMVAVTIPAPPQPSLYDLKFLSPGDRVDVMGISGQQQGETVSVKVANNVRVLAVDTIKSAEQEKKRIADINKDIKSLQDAKAAKMKETPPPSGEILKSNYDDPIAAKEKEKNPEIKNPSVTVEVTAQQAQVIALWRKSADLVVALHREEDATQVMFDSGTAAMPTAGGAPGMAGGVGPSLQPGNVGHVLTLEDVVPLDKRDPEKYVQRRQALDADQARVDDQAVNKLERQVKLAELRAELKNVNKYGTRSAPTQAGPAVGPAPAVPPAAVAASSPQVKALQAENKRLKAAAQKAKGGQQKPLERSVEVYRGKEKTVVNY